MSTSAVEALDLLKQGNKRFVTGNLSAKKFTKERLIDLAENGQSPFAIIVSCSDSRVPPEIIFDQGLGDIFVVRIAGNVINDVVMGSIEYAAEHLGVELVVILGHEKCGAVRATAEGGEAPGSICAIVDKIKPSVEKVKISCTCIDDLCEAATKENILAAVGQAKKSSIIKHLMHENKVTIIGAKYGLCTGEVIWY
jgi:carbonic anhydrase